MPRPRAAVPFLILAFLSISACIAAPAAAQQPSPVQLAALAGEYTDAAEPDTPVSFYVEAGKLVTESERGVPATLKPISPLEFAIPDTNATLRFTLDNAGRGLSAAYSSQPGAVYSRTGPPVHHLFHDYKRTEAMIPMRDGVKLHAVILKPADISAPLPFLMERTPYGVDGTTRASFFGQRPELARAGYIYVAEDIRGRYKSQGKFIMARPLADHRNPRATDESTDAYDTVAWLLKNIPGNNGRVGVVGTSYPGFLATMAGIDPHPAVKAISPQAPMIDVWLGDDFFHNGAFRQSYGYDYVLDMESSKEFLRDNYGKDRDIDRFDYFLERGSFLQDVMQSRSALLPTWKLFLEHPAYDSYWSSRGVEYHLDKVAVPTLSVGGYYDQEDMWGPQEEYAKLEAHDADHDNFLVLGPWRHGSWSSPYRHLGSLDYGEPIGTEFRARMEAKFFGHYLKGQPGFDLADTASFQTGSNTWQYYAHFPPAASHPASLYLAANGMLSWSEATSESKPEATSESKPEATSESKPEATSVSMSDPAADATTTYASNPADPVPYRHRPIQPTYAAGSQWYNWMTEDQRFVTGRSDVAVFKLPVLAQDLTLTGEVVADIYAATTGTDNDLVVKLIDQYPGDDPDPAMRGYQLMTNAEIFRGRYLSGFNAPQPLQPGSIHEYKFSLHDVDHVFKAGHTVMVEIQSTWFPLYDRNPQTFVPNIMKAQPSDYKPAAITIYSGAGHDSLLLVPVMGKAPAQ